MDNGVEFQNSVYKDWHVLSLIGRIDVTTSASVEEAGNAALNATEKNRGGHVKDRLHFQRGLACLVAPEQEGKAHQKVICALRRDRYNSRCFRGVGHGYARNHLQIKRRLALNLSGKLC